MQIKMSPQLHFIKLDSNKFQEILEIEYAVMHVILVLYQQNSVKLPKLYLKLSKHPKHFILIHITLKYFFQI